MAQKPGLFGRTTGLPPRTGAPAPVLTPTTETAAPLPAVAPGVSDNLERGSTKQLNLKVPEQVYWEVKTASLLSRMSLNDYMTEAHKLMLAHIGVSEEQLKMFNSQSG
jgi:hypothetical protein